MELTGESKDIVSDNISKLKKLFPEVVTGDKIDFKMLELILGEEIDNSKEKYSFTWPGKTQAIRESQKQSTGTLRPSREDSKNWDTTQNLYIEGDNLEVLKLLQKSYYNKIKAIYIDPPYNTGKDFIYTDNYQDNLENYLELTYQVGGGEFSSVNLTNNPETSGRFHTKWLNMLYPRLKLARNLLTDNGVIFISIDDMELNNLKKICDEIFGEENFIANIVVRRSINGKGDQKGFANNHEYVLCYQKSIHTIFNGLSPNEDYVNKFDKMDKWGKYKIDGILMKKGAGSNRQDAPTLFFPLYYNPDNGEVSLFKDKIHFKERFPIKSNGTEGRWTWGKEKIQNETYRLYASPNGTIYIKDYLTLDKRMKIRTILDDKEYITNKATNEIKEIFDNKVFPTPKPTKLIKDLLDTCLSKNDIVLDFFSGSSTTSESLFKLNNLNSLNCNFILIQMPEVVDEKSDAYNAGYNNICEIGKERIRRVGDKIVEESGNKDLDIGFKVFKLDSSNLEKWNPDYNNLQQSLTIDNIKEGRTNEDLVYEIMLKYGIDLTLPIEEHNNIYSIGFGALVICLDNNITKEIVNDIVDLTKDSSTSRVVFKDSGFKSDADKTNIKEILKTNHVDEFITI